MSLEDVMVSDGVIESELVAIGVEPAPALEVLLSVLLPQAERASGMAMARATRPVRVLFTMFSWSVLYWSGGARS